ncbi:MAG: imidazole glycerol phosphate synthase subunit HisH [Bacteroidetes bacterium]|nr:imidazole glycerol phosphate synthase subunit HisH [Bacteroidota bacterium]
MPAKIVIIDYGMGNLRSIHKKFQRIGYSAVVSGDINIIRQADKLILPGVGHFANAMKNLRELNLLELLNEMSLVKQLPILGICLGMQLLGKHSEEGFVDGLGWLDAEVKRFHVSDTLKFKIPHMGWNTTDIKKSSPLLSNIPVNSLFYFVHSYHMNCNSQEDILATTCYDYEFVSAVQKNNIFGTQFHPEKSFDYGETILKNFADL